MTKVLSCLFFLSIFSSASYAWNCNSNCKPWQLDCKTWKNLNCTREGRFAICVGIPRGPQTVMCLASLASLAAGPAGAPVVAAACGGAAAWHVCDCAKENGYISPTAQCKP